jgi:hypothetical protein
VNKFDGNIGMAGSGIVDVLSLVAVAPGEVADFALNLEDLRVSAVYSSEERRVDVAPALEDFVERWAAGEPTI